MLFTARSTADSWSDDSTTAATATARPDDAAGTTKSRRGDDGTAPSRGSATAGILVQVGPGLEDNFYCGR